MIVILNGSVLGFVSLVLLFVNSLSSKIKSYQLPALCYVCFAA